MSVTTQVDIPDVVVYDIMREAANRLGGALYALADRHPGLEAEYVAAAIDADRRARTVSAHDRVAVRDLDAQFRRELTALPARD